MKFTHKPTFNISFVDFLFNLLIVFIAISIVAVLHMRPPTKKQDSPRKAELMIEIEWNNESNNDIDIWLNGPEFSKPLHYSNKEMPPFLLDRDDVGLNSDKFIMTDGEELSYVYINREVLTMRGWPKPGEYFANLHFYKKSDDVVEEVRLTISTLNPYKILARKTFKMDHHWQEIDAVSFEVTSDKKIKNVKTKHGLEYVLNHFIRNLTINRNNVPSAM